MTLSIKDRRRCPRLFRLNVCVNCLLKDQHSLKPCHPHKLQKCHTKRCYRRVCDDCACHEEIRYCSFCLDDLESIVSQCEQLTQPIIEDDTHSLGIFIEITRKKLKILEHGNGLGIEGRVELETLYKNLKLGLEHLLNNLTLEQKRMIRLHIELSNIY